MYKFTHKDQEFMIEYIVGGEDQNINELLEHFRSFLISCTFSDEVVDRIVYRSPWADLFKASSAD